MLDSSVIHVVLYLEFLFISCACLYLVITLFISLSFVHLLGRIWDPGFACPDIESEVTPTEEDVEYLDSLAERL